MDRVLLEVVPETLVKVEPGAVEIDDDNTPLVVEDADDEVEEVLKTIAFEVVELDTTVFEDDVLDKSAGVVELEMVALEDDELDDEA